MPFNTTYAEEALAFTALDLGWPSVLAIYGNDAKKFLNEVGPEARAEAWRRMVENLALNLKWSKPEKKNFREGSWTFSIAPRSQERKPEQGSLYERFIQAWSKKKQRVGLPNGCNEGKELNEWLWSYWQSHLNSGNDAISEHEVWERLLDLRIGPSSFIKNPRAFNGTHWLDSFIQREKLLAERPVSQNVFLFAPNSVGLPGSTLKLDEFAKVVADGGLVDGVHLVGGVRGSGKSTLLNRIELLCNHWTVLRGRPFMIRFDLGSSVDPQKFLLSLLNTICRQVVEHTRSLPFVKGGERLPTKTASEDFLDDVKWFGWRSRLGIKSALSIVGAAGRWCSANFQWSCVMLLVLGIWIGWNSFVPALLKISAQRERTAIANWEGAAQSVKAWVFAVSNKNPSILERSRGGVAVALGKIPRETVLGYFRHSSTNSALLQVFTNAVWSETDLKVKNSNRLSAFTNLENQIRQSSAFGTSNDLFAFAEGLSTKAVKELGDLESIERTNTAGTNIMVMDSYSSQSLNRTGKKETADIAGYGLLSVVLLTMTAGQIHRARGRKAEACGTPVWSPLDTRDGAAALFAWSSIVCGILLVASLVSATIHGEYWFANTFSFLVFGVGFAAFFLAAQYCLPSWWHLKAKCKAMRVELRGKEEHANTTPDKESLANPVAGIAKLFLPVPSDTEAYHSMETPFLEQEVKRLLYRVSREFGRLVILIDDVDALPSKDFSTFMRLLRPISKVSGVVCIVTVPMHFYYHLYFEDANDIHSTAQGVCILGDPDLFNRPDPINPEASFKLKPNALNTLLVQVKNLLVAQLRISCELGTAPSFIADLAELWDCSNDPKKADAVRLALVQFGPSKREILRECLRLIDARASGKKTIPFEHLVRSSNGQKVLAQAKAEFGKAQTALECPV
ncbi:MAG: hypothetical protein H7246_20635 [Phycisphaerae bacterium]|nr:hypothetical protein [Saprospiraceae bacterium]